MSTVVSPRRRAGRADRRSRPRPAEARQESLFGALPAAPERPAPAEAEPAATPHPVEIEAAAPVAPAAPAEPAADAETVDLDAPSARAHRQGPTLDDLVAGAWEGLLAGVPAACPVCETTLAPRYSAGSGVVGGRCGGCGSTLG